MSQLVTVTKRFWPLPSRFFAVTFRDITLYVVNNHFIVRTIFVALNHSKKDIFNESHRHSSIIMRKNH